MTCPFKVDSCCTNDCHFADSSGRKSCDIICNLAEACKIIIDSPMFSEDIYNTINKIAKYADSDS